MLHRTPRWVWVGRTVAVAAVVGLTGYLWAAGPTRASAVATVAGVAIALAALVAPYLLSAYQPPTPPVPSSAPPQSDGGVVIIADHGSTAAQHINQVVMNAPQPDRSSTPGQAST